MMFLFRCLLLSLLLSPPLACLGADSIYEGRNIYNRSACDMEDVTRKYDRVFRSASNLFLPVEYKKDWCRIKAQAFCESSLQNDAVSHVGAMGIMQVMPGTWEELGEKLGRKGNPWSASWNIMYATFYMRSLLDKFYVERPVDCHWNMAYAAYEAGFARVLRTQRRSGGVECWKDMRQFHLVKSTPKYVTCVNHVLEKLRSHT